LLRLHEIAERDHRILNPFSDEKLRLTGELCRVVSGDRVLDLACGKGELLCTWADRHRIVGEGVDLSEAFLGAARARARELDVADRVAFVHGAAERHAFAPASFDLAACLGATWIGGGLTGTLELLSRAVKPDGLVLVGECWWSGDEPPAERVAEHGYAPGLFASLAGTADRIADAGLELVEMVVADHDDWDRYNASQWWAIERWLREHPQDDVADDARAFRDSARRSYLAFGREQLAWGVFLARKAA